MSQTLFSVAVGVGTKNSRGDWLEVYYPRPLLHPSQALVETLSENLRWRGGNSPIPLDDRCSLLAKQLGDRGETVFAAQLQDLTRADRPAVITLLENDSPITSVPEAYLKLHLLSHRLVQPNGLDLTNIFATLPNVAWTSEGAIDLEELPDRQWLARLKGQVLNVESVDKFPKMTDYVVPKGIRIADTARVRLGAHIGEGSTVMHEGFVNFNAGTLGVSMVEGRISAGIVVGSGSDLGGGCSTMGTLSGGNDIVVSIGENCLVGANAGINIPLGDRCTVEAGLYVTAGSKVNVFDSDRSLVKTVKAVELAGQSNLLFRRNSQSGAIECLANASTIELNEALHTHN